MPSPVTMHYRLLVKGDFTNVKSIFIPQTIRVSVQCTRCHRVHPRMVTVCNDSHTFVDGEHSNICIGCECGDALGVIVCEPEGETDVVICKECCDCSGNVCSDGGCYCYKEKSKVCKCGNKKMDKDDSKCKKDDQCTEECKCDKECKCRTKDDSKCKNDDQCTDECKCDKEYKCGTKDDCRCKKDGQCSDECKCDRKCKCRTKDDCKCKKDGQCSDECKCDRKCKCKLNSTSRSGNNKSAHTAAIKHNKLYNNAWYVSHIQTKKCLLVNGVDIDCKVLSNQDKLYTDVRVVDGSWMGVDNDGVCCAIDEMKVCYEECRKTE